MAMTLFVSEPEPALPDNAQPVKPPFYGDMATLWIQDRYGVDYYYGITPSGVLRDHTDHSDPDVDEGIPADAWEWLAWKWRAAKAGGDQ